MDVPMRRALLLSSLFGVILAGLGCKNHTTGRCDCTYNPASQVISAPSNPYPTVGGPAAMAPTAPMAVPAASAPMVMPTPGKLPAVSDK